MTKLDIKSSYYKDAMTTVERNINYIYINEAVDAVITEIRDWLSIDKNLYKTLQKKSDKIDKIYNLEKFFQYLTDEWIKQSFKSEETKKNLAEIIVRKKIKKESNDLSQAEINKQAERVTISEIEYQLKREIEIYHVCDIFLTFPTRINMNIWKAVVDARLFNVPVERILKFKKTILDKYYLPKVFMENGSIYIKINELTKKDDITLIWKRNVEKVKNSYKIKYKNEHALRSCKNDVTDRILLKLYNKGLKPIAISKALFENYKISMDSKKVLNRLKEIKKRAKFNEKKKILLQFSG